MSFRDMLWQVSQVLSSLTSVMDPDLGADIVSLGFIKNLTVTAGGSVDFVLELTTPACPVKDQLKAQCVEAVSTLPWVKGVSVAISSRPMAAPAPEMVREAEAGAGVVGQV